MHRIALLNPLRHRTFRLLFLGQVISNLGDWLDYVAVLTLIVYQWHLGASALAAYTTAIFLPVVLLGPLAGVWVDRWPHRMTLITSDLLRAILVLGLVWAPNLPILLLIAVAKVTVSTFFSPAQQALIRSTVPDEDLLAANALSQLSQQATKIIGPAIGGFIVLISGTGVAFVGDALSFLASAIILSQLPRTIAAISATSAHEKKFFWQEFRMGFTSILQSRTLVVAISCMAATSFVVFTFDTLSALAIQLLGFGPSLFGLSFGLVGLGTAVGAVFVGQWGQKIPPLKLMASGNAVAGLMVALIGGAILFHTSILAAIWLLVWLITGLAAAALIVPYGYILQKETPSHLMGRVSASATGLQTTLQLLSPLVGALVASSFGVGTVFFIAGIALAILGSALFLIRIQSSSPKPDTDIVAVSAETEIS